MRAIGAAVVGDDHLAVDPAPRNARIAFSTQTPMVSGSLRQGITTESSGTCSLSGKSISRITGGGLFSGWTAVSVAIERAILPENSLPRAGVGRRIGRASAQNNQKILLTIAPPLFLYHDSSCFDRGGQSMGAKSLSTVLSCLGICLADISQAADLPSVETVLTAVDRSLQLPRNIRIDSIDVVRRYDKKDQEISSQRTELTLMAQRRRRDRRELFAAAGKEIWHCSRRASQMRQRCRWIH